MNMFDTVRFVIDKNGTDNPEEILASQGVKVFYLPMSGLRGVYKALHNVPMVFVDSGLDDQQRKFVLAHELAHHLLHSGFNRVFLDRSTYLKTDKYEREADLFAACFLHPFPKEYFHDGVTVKEISQTLGLDEPAAELYCDEFRKNTSHGCFK